MGDIDKISERFEKRQERKRLDAALVNPDDPPLPDVPVEQAQSKQAVGRNDPCPCGSGQKYKKCCGKQTP